MDFDVLIPRAIISNSMGDGRRHRGDGGRVPPVRNSGEISPRNGDFQKENFLNISKKFQIFQYFQNKVAEMRGEIGIWG